MMRGPLNGGHLKIPTTDRWVACCSISALSFRISFGEAAKQSEPPICLLVLCFSISIIIIIIITIIINHISNLCLAGFA